jgi:hypothetical protein
MVLLAWNPLVVLHAAGDAHNDAVMLLFVSLAMYLAVRGRSLWASVALAGAVLIKFVPVLLLPLLVASVWRSEREHSRQRVLLSLLVVPLAVELAYLPFWDGWRTLQPSLDEGSYLTTSPQAALTVLVNGSLRDETTGSVLSVVSRLLFIPLLVMSVARIKGGHSLPGEGALLLVLWLAVATPWFMPWYALWPLVFVAAVPWRRDLLAVVVALTGGALLLPAVTGYLMPMSGQGRGWPLLHILGAAVVWGPVVLTGAVLWRRLPWRAWTEARASRSVAASRAPVAGEAGD